MGSVLTRGSAEAAGRICCSRYRRRNIRLGFWGRSIATVSLLCLAAGSVGCGVNLNEVLFQSSTAVGRTYLDLLLTDLANSIAGLSEVPEPPPTDGNGDGDGNGGDGTNGGDGPPPDDGFDDLTGDPAAGEAIYANNGCGGCHCADASGGCLPGAPALIGASADTLDDILRGSAPHPAKVDLSNQEIVDLEAYLASL